MLTNDSNTTEEFKLTKDGMTYILLLIIGILMVVIVVWYLFFICYWENSKRMMMQTVKKKDKDGGIQKEGTPEVRNTNCESQKSIKVEPDFSCLDTYDTNVHGARFQEHTKAAPTITEWKNTSACNSIISVTSIQPGTIERESTKFLDQAQSQQMIVEGILNDPDVDDYQPIDSEVNFMTIG